MKDYTLPMTQAKNTIKCRKCESQPGQYCLSKNGKKVSNCHLVRIHDWFEAQGAQVVQKRS